MWLRLTRRDNNKQQLYNMNRVNAVANMGGYTILSKGKGSVFEVLESIDEIEIMLAGKGVEVRRADPGERSWIGAQQAIFDKDQAARDAAGWDEGNSQDA